MSWINIDTQILDNFLKNKGMTRSQASLEIGRDSSYLNKVIKRGTIQTNDYICIKSLYGIDIKKKDEPVRKSEENYTTIGNMSPEAFSDLIYKAVYKAVKDAYWGEDGEEETYTLTDEYKKKLGVNYE